MQAHYLTRIKMIDVMSLNTNVSFKNYTIILFTPTSQDRTDRDWHIHTSLF
jgi:hypothetical protein